ncbi:thiamine-phosphate kinase [Salipaludibacillus keqinensis]|uniref:Thiamine-monophosphate kinase n=1 Tax=Salipaludibacillus keqinensis TaxID=2045207 RepID=A0A323T8E6_9BACI|nr:thiamine-phosphate kinase [Salipaludibacillus keqinensis]PYZ92152.1 thiamine-phosphate kinase [Salipaludibacillus keqinensis]
MNNEFDWIQSVSPKKLHQPSVKVGIGDDAAIYSVHSEFDQVVAVDTMVEGIHFTRKTMPIKSIGYKALAVNLSDLAAMGAIPLYYLVSVAVPKQGWTQEELSKMYEGMDQLACKWQVDLIGGDTVSIRDTLVLTVTVIGKVKRDRHLLRSQAEEGDVLFVTGEVGLSAYALEHLLNDESPRVDQSSFARFLKAHQEPEPQLEAGQLLAKGDGRVSLNDVSDGLAHEAKEIAEASGVNIVIDWDSLLIPQEFNTHPIEKQEDWMLYGGEDFQLVGTVSAHYWNELVLRFKEHHLLLHKIGRVEKGEGTVFMKRHGTRSIIEKSGYHHF